VIRREDHRRDALGAVFLGAVAGDTEICSYVERYLGSSVRIRSVQLEGDVLRVVVESAGFRPESQNLVRLGRSLLERGRTRAAADMFNEAMRLDSMNTEALKAAAGLRFAHGDLTAAKDLWIRAAEIGGYGGEILRGLAAVALQENRAPSAMRYLDEALMVNPDDAESAKLLQEMKRQREIAFAAASGVEKGEGADPEKA
jgi:tetratricopeptide (TPR) repeat protein